MPGQLPSRIVPRTTLDLDSSVLRELRARGTREGKSMGRVASELLAPALMPPTEPPAVRPLRWTSRSLGAPLVDLEDKEAVWAILDQEGQ